MEAYKKLEILSEGQKNGISKTCQKHKISRTLYYRWLNRYKSHGIEGLNIQRKGQPANKTSSDVEENILRLIKSYPTYGPRSIMYLLEELDYRISESAVFNVMKRHNLTNRQARQRFSHRRQKKVIDTLPDTQTINSGECWVFWIKDYGYHKTLGQLYEYTLIDLKSKIACSRIYQTITIDSFEDLLLAVAMPVAQSLRFQTKYLCFFDQCHLKHHHKNFQEQIRDILSRSNFDVKIHLIKNSHIFNGLQENYTKACISFLLPKLNKSIVFNEVKLAFQKYIRRYNIEETLTYEDGVFTPVNYHCHCTHTNVILPLWAYLDRNY